MKDIVGAGVPNRGLLRRQAVDIWHACWIAVVGALAGCGAQTSVSPLSRADGARDPATPATPAVEGKGTLDVSLMWETNWDDVSALHYELTGPDGSPAAFRQADVDTAGQELSDFAITDLPPGTCYGLSVSGVHADDQCNAAIGGSLQTCADVLPGTTTKVVMQVGSGDLLCNGAVVDCPVINALGSVSQDGGLQIALTVGGTVSLTASAAAPIPQAISYVWTSSNPAVGTLAETTQPSAGTSTSDVFTCLAPGTTEVTVETSDGAPEGTCDPGLTTMSIAVVCSGAPSDAAAPEDGSAAD